MAAAYLYAVEREENLAERTIWLKKARMACLAALRHGGIDLAGQAESQRLWGLYEWLLDHKSAARRWCNRSADTARRYSQPYEAAMTYTMMGERMHWREFLTHAETIFQKTGALYDLARVHQIQDSWMVK